MYSRSELIKSINSPALSKATLSETGLKRPLVQYRLTALIHDNLSVIPTTAFSLLTSVPVSTVKGANILA